MRLSNRTSNKAVSPGAVSLIGRDGEDYMRQFALIVIAASVLLSPASAADAADAVNGGRLAQRWCASCHIVASDQRRPTDEATPFSSIARHAGFNEERLAFFLLDPHPKMPNMSLTRSEAADLAAYIAAQK